MSWTHQQRPALPAFSCDHLLIVTQGSPVFWRPSLFAPKWGESLTPCRQILPHRTCPPVSLVLDRATQRHPCTPLSSLVQPLVSPTPSGCHVEGSSAKPPRLPGCPGTPMPAPNQLPCFSQLLSTDRLYPNSQLPRPAGENRCPQKVSMPLLSLPRLASLHLVPEQRVSSCPQLTPAPGPQLLVPSACTAIRTLPIFTCPARCSPAISTGWAARGTNADWGLFRQVPSVRISSCKPHDDDL